MSNSSALYGQLNNSQVQDKNFEFFLPFEGYFTDIQKNAYPKNIGGKFVDGKIGKAVHLNGLGEYIRLQRKFFDQYETLSVSLWIKPEKSEEEQIVLWQGESEEDLSIEKGARLIVSPDGTEVIFKMQENNEELILNSSIEKNSWNHVVITLRNPNSLSPSARLFVDGNLTSSISFDGRLNTDLNTSLFIGRPRAKNYFFKGGIDELRFYSADLSEPQVKLLFDEGVSCYKDSDCGISGKTIFCKNDSLCTKNIYFSCILPGKNSYCQNITKDFCKQCDLNCSEGKCIEKSTPIEIPENNSQIVQQPEASPSFFKKLKCKIFHPFSKEKYLNCRSI